MRFIRYVFYFKKNPPSVVLRAIPLRATPIRVMPLCATPLRGF